MDILKFATLAVSKDKSRYNLTEVYRDKNELVGCDGHRLHVVTGLPDAKPGFLSGLDAEFPDWRMVAPMNVPRTKFTFTIDRDNLVRLKAMAGLAKTYDRQCSGRISFSEPGDNWFVVQVQPCDLVCAYRIDCHFATPPLTDAAKKDYGINLSYLFDALQGAYQLLRDMVTIEASLFETSQAMRFDVQLDEKLTATALIMPMRVD